MDPIPDGVFGRNTHASAAAARAQRVPEPQVWTRRVHFRDVLGICAHVLRIRTLVSLHGSDRGQESSPGARQDRKSRLLRLRETQIPSGPLLGTSNVQTPLNYNNRIIHHPALRSFSVSNVLGLTEALASTSDSFVRSISMDTWQADQLKRMQIGGNAAFKEFMSSYYPPEQGGYKESNTPYEIYHCWAATQYREKLDAEIAGKEWAQSAPPPPSLSNSTDSAGLRKSRASGRSNTGSSLRADSASPASFTKGSPRGTPDLGADQKSANESYFASLGATNASRSADLPPSQGGRYQGFGNTPSPPAASQHPSYGLSSAAAPSFSDIQENPVAALSKGWSLFSAAVGGAARAVSENVIQPAAERVRDPTLQASVLGWSKNAFGVDVAESVGGVVGTVKDRIGPSPARDGYGTVGMGHDGETSGLYHDDDEDLFTEYQHGDHYDQPVAASAPASSPKPKDNNGWDDEWKDF
ncbi:ArfGap-domain-containing protein [Mycena sanguinolenta]|uniref:ArfGap-domain-containing protein n=1 Tax=Mycena sanguinolenta TaxID=230812 RepID=A0A8H7D1S6_9AGAR|nr:ArfGap-domain-containing protein [Mycena sanguinolenta]